MIHFKLVQYLADRGYFRANSRIMDVGTQNLLFAEEESAVELASMLRTRALSEEDLEGIKRVCYFSTPRAGERTAFLHEFLEFTDVVYDSIDIVDGHKTTIFDLNFDTTPGEWIGAFDFLINCGTLEHVIHQYKALGFIHDVLKVGAVWFDQPPSVGFLNHGYYNYNPLFYLDMAAANSYDLVEAWYSHAGGYPIWDQRFPIISLDLIDTPAEREKATRKPFSDVDKAQELSKYVPKWLSAAPAERLHEPEPEMGLSYNFNVAMRKMIDAPLQLPLEVRTTHGPVGANVQAQYGRFVFDSTAKK